MKYNARILLFEQFIGVISNFGSVQPENEFTLPSRYNKIFETRVGQNPGAKGFQIEIQNLWEK